jgi:hypothetical protein
MSGGENHAADGKYNPRRSNDSKQEHIFSSETLLGRMLRITATAVKLKITLARANGI